MKKNKKNNKGIALLMAVLISGLFFVISAAVYKIALIELILSSTGRDSQFAFYAADTGAECALYWDRKFSGNGQDTSGSAFSKDSSSGKSNRDSLVDNTEGVSMISCLGTAVTNFCVNGRFAPPGAQPSGAPCLSTNDEDTAFQLNQTINGYNYCADVIVKKDTSGPLITYITSQGYNTCNVSNPRRVERAIKVTIQ